MKKIKITQTQLNILMEQNVGGEFPVDNPEMNNGEDQTDEMTTPEPYEMAQKTADLIMNSEDEGLRLHPDYYENEDLYREYVNALSDILLQRVDGEDEENNDNQEENPFDNSNQMNMNESIEILKRDFDRFK